MNRYLISGVLVSFLGISLAFSGLSAKEEKNALTQQQRIEAYNKLTKIINTVEAYYVDDININEIIDKAIDGLMTNLDAHSGYLTEKNSKI